MVFELAIIQLLIEYEEANKPVDCIVVYSRSLNERFSVLLG